MLRKASLVDIYKIRTLEKSQYKNKFISERIMIKWIKNGNFYVIEEDSKILGSIYLEFLEEINSMPWEHDPLPKESGKYLHISEITAESNEVIDALLEKTKEIGKDCKAIILPDNENSDHLEIMKNNGFEKYEEDDMNLYILNRPNKQ